MKKNCELIYLIKAAKVLRNPQKNQKLEHKTIRNNTIIGCVLFTRIQQIPFSLVSIVFTKGRVSCSNNKQQYTSTSLQSLNKTTTATFSSSSKYYCYEKSINTHSVCVTVYKQESARMSQSL